MLEAVAIWCQNTLGLSRLAPHFDRALYTLVACFGLQCIISPLLSSCCSRHYRNLKPKTKRDWDIRVVAFVHAVYAVYNSANLVLDPITLSKLSADKVFAYDSRAEDILAVSLGYFTWDTIISTALVSSQGIGFLLHAASCFATFAAGFLPVLQYFGPIFLLWETSSIFLNVHWALDKLELTGSTLQLINGILLLTTFFFFRIVFGSYAGYIFLTEINRPDVKAALPFIVPHLFTVSYLVLTCLNVYWFRQMVRAIRKRFNGSPNSH